MIGKQSGDQTIDNIYILCNNGFAEVKWAFYHLYFAYEGS